MSTLLADQQRRAINDFLGEHWSDFVEVAARYLSADEIEELGVSLQGE